MNEYVSKYLEEKGKTAINELTDNEVEGFFDNDFVDVGTKCSIETAKRIVRRGIITYEEYMTSLRKSLELGEPFVCVYITNEGVRTPEWTPAKESGWILKP